MVVILEATLRQTAMGSREDRQRKEGVERREKRARKKEERLGRVERVEMFDRELKTSKMAEPGIEPGCLGL